MKLTPIISKPVFLNLCAVTHWRASELILVVSQTFVILLKVIILYKDIFRSLQMSNLSRIKKIIKQPKMKFWIKSVMCLEGPQFFIINLFLIVRCAANGENHCSRPQSKKNCFCFLRWHNLEWLNVSVESWDWTCQEVYPGSWVTSSSASSTQSTTWETKGSGSPHRSRMLNRTPY